MEFNKALKKHFMFRTNFGRDNLPILASEASHPYNYNNWGRKGLGRLMRDLGYTRGVEIGTNTGWSARCWCQRNHGMHLTCVDPYSTYSARGSQKKQDSNYEKALAALKPYNAEIIRECSLDVVDSFEDDELDFVYIDGDHTFDPVMQDLIRWAPKVQENGLIMLHDYCVFTHAGIIEAVNAYTTCHRIDPWFVTRDSTPTAFWRKGAACI